LAREEPATAAVLICLENELSVLGGGLSFFGFLISRLLRLLPLAIAERPFDESCVRTGLRTIGLFETVLRGHPLMAFVVVADAILRRAALRRERRRDLVNVSGRGSSSKLTLQRNGLPDLEEVRWSFGSS